MKDKRSPRGAEQQEDINISPLIDMVFILLIFFIVTTVFVEEPGIDVIKPMALNASDLEKNCVLIAVTANGQVMYGGADIGIAGVRAQVRRLMKENDAMPVIIQADVNSQSGLVIKVVDECKLAQATRIFVSTLKT